MNKSKSVLLKKNYFGRKNGKVISIYGHKIFKKIGRHNFFISWKTTKKNLPGKTFYGKIYNTQKDAQIKKSHRSRAREARGRSPKSHKRKTRKKSKRKSRRSRTSRARRRSPKSRRKSRKKSKRKNKFKLNTNAEALMKKKRLYDRCLDRIASEINANKSPVVKSSKDHCNVNGELVRIKQILKKYAELSTRINNRANASKEAHKQYTQSDLQVHINKNNNKVIKDWYKRWNKAINKMARDLDNTSIMHGTSPSTFLASYAKGAIKRRGAPFDFVKLVKKRMSSKQISITMKVRAKSAKKRVAARKERARAVYLAKALRAPRRPPTERENWAAHI